MVGYVLTLKRHWKAKYFQRTLIKFHDNKISKIKLMPVNFLLQLPQNTSTYQHTHMSIKRYESLFKLWIIQWSKTYEKKQIWNWDPKDLFGFYIVLNWNSVTSNMYWQRESNELNQLVILILTNYQFKLLTDSIYQGSQILIRLGQQTQQTYSSILSSFKAL